MDSELLGASQLAKTVLSIACCLAAPAISQSVRTQSIETEARRLETVRTLVNQEKSRRLGGGPDGKPKKTAAICDGMLNDLLNQKGFKAIEPLAVLDHEYPIQNPDRSIYERDAGLLPPREKLLSQKTAEKLGPFFTKSIQRCTDEQAQGDERKGDVLFSGFRNFAGAPPFRAYVLPKKVNPFPEAKLVYWSELTENRSWGRKGYSWVNLDTCEHLPSAPGWGWSLKNEPAGPVGALTQYRSKLAIWDVSPNISFSSYLYDPTNKAPLKSQVMCNWATYPETSIKK